MIYQCPSDQELMYKTFFLTLICDLPNINCYVSKLSDLLRCGVVWSNVVWYGLVEV